RLISRRIVRQGRIRRLYLSIVAEKRKRNRLRQFKHLFETIFSLRQPRLFKFFKYSSKSMRSAVE
ncbi:MAG: hypothetical protein AAF539_16680, partial [Planctomycetota bacterium]